MDFVVRFYLKKEIILGFKQEIWLNQQKNHHNNVNNLVKYNYQFKNWKLSIMYDNSWYPERIQK